MADLDLKKYTGDGGGITVLNRGARAYIRMAQKS